MPVRKYKTRYVVFEVSDYEALKGVLNNVCNTHPDFRLRVVREYNGVVVVKCPHKAVPILRVYMEDLAKAKSGPGIKIIGVSGTLRKAVSKFCIRRSQQKG